MAKAGKGYLNMGWSKLVNIILTIIFPIHWILGGITRIMRGHLIAGILNIIPMVNFVFWVTDLISTVTDGDLTFYA